MVGMALVYLVQHGEKEPSPGDPALDGQSSRQAGAGLQAFVADMGSQPGPVAAVTCRYRTRRRPPTAGTHRCASKDGPMNRVTAFSLLNTAVGPRADGSEGPGGDV
jgi:hypothetical protein